LASTEVPEVSWPPGVERGEVLYEARYEAAGIDPAEFDTWLRDRIADVLQCTGFLSAEILQGDELTEAAVVRRTVQYRVTDASAHAAFMAADSARLEAVGQFAGDCTIARRVLRVREQFQRGAVSTENCLNCGEVLRGQHCQHCGQRARVRVLSLTAVLGDVIGDLLNWDARIWRTLRPLAFRPGLLTQEFLRGRRARYTPPFRLYLGLSVAFFLAAAVDLPIGDDVDGEMRPVHFRFGTESEDTATTGMPAQSRKELAESIVRTLPEGERERALQELSRQLDAMDEADYARFRQAAANPCNELFRHAGEGAIPEGWEPRLRTACERILTDSQGFNRALFENVPRTMFLFLPLIAVLMQFLYAGSGRFYVEHLLFFMHYHSWIFLGGLLLVLLRLGESWLAGTALAGVLRSAGNAMLAVLVIWSPLYLYLAMRRVYAQGRAVTLVKYALLVVGYAAGMVVTGVALLVYTALTL
jgi:hypothetical protein